MAHALYFQKLMIQIMVARMGAALHGHIVTQGKLILLFEYRFETPMVYFLATRLASISKIVFLQIHK